MFGDWSGSWGWMWGVCWIFVILFWAVIIFGLAALARPLLASGASANRRGGRRLDILKDRYARSEISRDQYEQMRGDLG
jgi:putative membrane protein